MKMLIKSILFTGPNYVFYMEHTKNISTVQMKKMIGARFDSKQDEIQ
jgi:hypothetical protein